MLPGDAAVRQAIATFEKALAVNPLHASAEFALARSLQRTGHTAEARQHFARFQHLTSARISSALGLAYGEQGHYSTVTAVEEPETIEHAMIPFRLVARPLVSATSGIIIHHHGRRVHDGCYGLGENGPGADAIGRAGYSRTARSWRRELSGIGCSGRRAQGRRPRSGVCCWRLRWRWAERSCCGAGRPRAVVSQPRSRKIRKRDGTGGPRATQSADGHYICRLRSRWRSGSAADWRAASAGWRVERFVAQQWQQNFYRADRADRVGWKRQDRGDDSDRFQ